MITGSIKSQVDRIWDAFWSGGISNPMEVIEQMTYLLFIKRLDEIHTAREKKASRLRREIEEPIFNGKQQKLRWSVFKQMGDPAAMYDIVANKVFPFIKTLGDEGSTYATHMKDERFTIPTPALLAKVVDLLDAIPMEDRDTKGDLYEYMLGKIASAGQNGQFRTPRHVIKLMVEMMAPKPSDTICDPACGTAGFLVAAAEYLETHHSDEIYKDARSRHFSVPAKLPQIAISVDMLDTGIDGPEIVNLVFFKAVRSKVKFLQMIGRGTRLCPDLFGPGQDKSEFLIFDFCGNFEYFNENPAGATSPVGEPLGKRLFKRRLELLELLPADGGSRRTAEDRAGYTDGDGLRDDLIAQLHGEVAAMNVHNFIVRTELEHVTRFAERASWDALDPAALVELRDQVAGLPSEQEAEHITAKLFDLTCLSLQIAMVKASGDFIRWRDKVIDLASQLETKAAIPAVNAQLPLIQEIQTEAFWKDITLPMLESVRRRLRGLVQFVDRKSFAPVYTALTDEKGESTEVQLKDFSTGINLAQYKRKVEAFIRASENHVAIAKLRHNKPLTPTDLRELERFVYQADVVDGQKRFEEAFGSETQLPVFIRSLVGMDRNAAKQAFGRFLDDSRYSSQQIRFVEMIVDRLTLNGAVDPGQLYEPPFTSVHHEGQDGAFCDSDANAIVDILIAMSERAAA